MTRTIFRIAVLAALFFLTAGLFFRGLSQAGPSSGLGQVQYPTALDGPTSLFGVTNNASTYVARTAAATDSTLYAGSTSAFPATGALVIAPFNSFSGEVVFYSGKTSNSFIGCIRGADGTVAVNHSMGETVSLRIDAVHVNNPITAILALETKLGIGATTPASGSFLKGGPGGSSAWSSLSASDVTGALTFTPLNKAGDTMTGSLILSGDPATALGAATKQYVDSHSGLFSFNTRTGAVTLLSSDVTSALGYSPQTPLDFVGALAEDSSGNVACPTCEVTSNRNIGNGYAGLDVTARLPRPLGQEVWSVSDLTDYDSVSGNGTTAVRATITSPTIGQALTWNGSSWVNSTVSGGSGGGYSTVANAGAALTVRTVLNFSGTALTASDNSAQSRTDVALSESPSTSTSVVGVDRMISTGTGLTGGGTLASDLTLSVLPDTTNQRVQLLDSSATLIGSRHALQLLTGGALSWTLTDDAANNRLDVQPVLSVSPGGATTLVGTTRAISTTSPLSGGGALGSDLTLSIPGLSSLGSGNQLVGVNSGANGWEYKTLSGATNQVNVAFGSGAITLSLPQSIDTGSSPTWAGLNITGVSSLVIGSNTAVSGTNAISILVSNAATKPQLRYLSTGTGTGKWQFSNDGTTFTDLGSGGGGITSLNALTAASQSFATGTSGTDFNISSASGVHTFNIPSASASARGLVTTGAQTFGGAKTITLGSVGYNVVTLTDGATVSTDCSQGNRFRVTLAGNRTLANPTNAVDGGQYVWEVIQDSTGGRTLSFGSNFVFGSDIPTITLTTTANKRDFITATYNAGTGKFYVQGFIKGF